MRTSLSVLLISILISSFLYSKSLSGEFVYDDFNWAKRSDLRDRSSFLTIWTEPYIRDLPENGTYRPLTIFTFALNFSLLGESTVGFHMVNIVLNALVVFLVFKVVQALFQNDLLAVFSALFFAFMPLHVEAIAFIKSRDELLKSAFLLTSLFFFIKAFSQNYSFNRKFIIVSTAFYSLALLAKETAIIAPLQFLIVTRLAKNIKTRKLATAIFPFAIVSGVYLVIRYLILGPFAFGTDNLAFALNPIRNAPLPSRFLTACTILFLYVSKAFIPWNLSATYHYRQLEPYYSPFQSITIPLGIFCLLILVIFILHKKTRISPLGIGAMFFLTSYVIISRFFFTAGEIMAERMLYYPSVGLSMMSGYVFFWIYQRKKLTGIVLFAATIIFYTVVIIPRNNIWLSPKNLGESMIHDTPRSFQGYFMLATIEFNGKNYARAKEYAQKAYALEKTFPSLLHLMGRLAIVEERYDLAEKLLKKSLASSNQKEVIKYLSYTLAKQGKYRESANLLLPRIDNYADDKQIKTLLGIDFLKLGQEEKAKEYLQWNGKIQEFEEKEILDQFD